MALNLERQFLETKINFGKIDLYMTEWWMLLWLAVWTNRVKTFFVEK